MSALAKSSIQDGGAKLASTRTELLEDHQVDAVGVDLERHRQMLPAEVAAEAVDQPRRRAHDPDRVRVGLDVGGRQQAGLERVAERCPATGPAASRGSAGSGCRARTAGSGPRGAAATSAGAARAAWRTSTAGCASGRRRRRACRKAVAARTFRRSRRRAPRRASAPSGPARTWSGARSLRVARSRPIVAARMSEWPMKAARLGPSGRASSACDVLLAVRPGLVLVDGGDDVLAGDRLDPAEQVAGVDAVDVDGRQRARPQHHGGHAVAHRLRQRGAAEHLDVVVGVDVEHARQHPLAGRVDDLRAVRGVEGVRR